MSSVDVAAQQKRINELALQDVDSLAEQQRQCAAELKALPDAIKEAAKAAEYKEAARLQERVDLLNRSATELAAARAMSVRAKRRRAPAALLPADAVKSQAASVFGERVAEVTGPLRPCVDATLAVLAEGLRIAASEGVSEVRIRRAPDVDAAIKSKHVFDPAAANSRAEHEIRRAASHGDVAYREAHEAYVAKVTRVFLKVEYFVDVGFCWVPVGKGLGVPADDAAADAEWRDDFAILHAHHLAIAGFRAELERDAFVELCGAFDGDGTHAFAEVSRAVAESEVARMLLRWRLRDAGYASRAHSGVAELVKEWHRKNHAARATNPTADVLSFRSEQFRAFQKPGLFPAPGGVCFLVAHGEAGARLTEALGDGAEAVAGFTRADGKAASFEEYVEACVAAASSDAYESGFYSRRNATGANAAARTVPAMPEVIAAAGTASLRNLCAREKFQQARRDEGEAPTSPASPVSTPAGFNKTYTPSLSSMSSPASTPASSARGR